MDTKLPDEPSTAFAVPRRIFAGRKRRAEDADHSSFFTADDFAAFSVRGDAHESRLYGPLETRRQTLVTPTVASSRKSSAAMKIKKQTKNLVQLLVEAIEAKRIRAPEKMLELDNARRRVSGLSVAEHERYLMLQRKIFQAQQHGLPEVLALSQDEAAQWKKMKTDVEYEQVGFCRMMARGLAAENAACETQLPQFAASWYTAMLTQCWNDIYRLYPRWFEPCLTVQLPSGGALGDMGTATIKAKEVATRGTCCTIDLRKLESGQPLKSSDDNEGLALDVVSPRHAISADSQAEELMFKYDCDIAISSSTLVTLFDSDTSTRFAHVPADWGIPMKSRAIVHGDGGNAKKRIFLDRPLPGQAPGTREKVAEAGRAALLSRFEIESVVEGSTGGRTAYYIWQLEDKRILVRSTIHASMVTYAPKAVDTPSTAPAPSDKKLPEKQKQTITPLSVFVKPDYHLLGVEEQLTTSERCRFWLHSWLRGGAAVLVARVDPVNGVVSSWSTYPPSTLIYGDKALQTVPLENFDPSAKFQWLSSLFTALGDIPVGNYLLRPHDAIGSSTFGKRRGGMEVLMATAEPSDEKPVVDLYSFMPKTNAVGSAITLQSMDSVCAMLPAWNLHNRIPYTFQTGMYCQPFFLEGHCPLISRGESCDFIHLRFPEHPAGSAKSVKTKRWKFENYTKVLKKAARANFEVLNRPKLVTLNYAFCGEDKPPPSSPCISQLFTPPHCPKLPGECTLPHLSLHQLLERLADDLLRKGRGKRRAQKNENRQHRADQV